MILSFLRKNYKVVVSVFSTIFVAFVGQEVFAIYIYKRSDNKELQSVITINDRHISYKELQDTINMYNDSMRRSYGLGKNVKLIVDNSKTCADAIITSQAYSDIAKNLHFIVSNAEANSLLKENLYESNNANITEQERKKNREQVENKITEIEQSETLQDSFRYVVQKSTENKNQQKIEKLLDSMCIYNDLDCEYDWAQSNDKMDVEYLYIPLTLIDKQLTDIDYNDIKPDSKSIEEYINKHHYDYRQKERYRIYYFLYDYELSAADIEVNKKRIEDLANRFKHTFFNDNFISLYNGKNKDAGKKNDVKTVDFDSLPGTIKEANTISIGDVFYDIAQTSADMNIIYKVTDIVSDDTGTKKYTIASIYSQPYISEATKDNMLKVVAENVQFITTPQSMRTLSEEENRKLYDQTFEPSSKSIENIEGGRKFIIEINKKCYGKYGEDGILRLEPRKQTNNILFGFIVEHIENGHVKVDDNAEKVISKIKNNITNTKKCDLMLNTLSKTGIKDLPFDVIKNKIKDNTIKENYIKYGEDSVDLSYLKLKDFGQCNVKFLSLLKEGDDTGFIKMDNGIIRIRVKKRSNKTKRHDINKDFYDKQKKIQQKELTLTSEQISEFFNVKNYLNNYI